jgi:hypothetical protein
MLEQFPITSRYHGLETKTYSMLGDRTIVYLCRRFVPPPERFEQLREHVVGEDERPDLIAAQHLGDPEQFWRICDANNAMHPDDLTAEPGQRLRITLPEGLTGVVL